MEIRKSKEILVLTQVEKAILFKAQDILQGIYIQSEDDGDMEYHANDARQGINYLLEEAEVEGGEPEGEIKVVLMT